jgi:hypothetical protein
LAPKLVIEGKTVIISTSWLLVVEGVGFEVVGTSTLKTYRADDLPRVVNDGDSLRERHIGTNIKLDPWVFETAESERWAKRERESSNFTGPKFQIQGRFPTNRPSRDLIRWIFNL